MMREATRRRRPTTPGEILREEFLLPLRLTQRQLAGHLGCDLKVINRIINGRTSVTAEMALKLGAAFGPRPSSGSTLRRPSTSIARRATCRACRSRCAEQADATADQQC